MAYITPVFPQAHSGTLSNDILSSCVGACIAFKCVLAPMERPALCLALWC